MALNYNWRVTGETVRQDSGLSIKTISEMRGRRIAKFVEERGVKVPEQFLPR